MEAKHKQNGVTLHNNHKQNGVQLTASKPTCDDLPSLCNTPVDVLQSVSLYFLEYPF